MKFAAGFLINRTSIIPIMKGVFLLLVFVIAGSYSVTAQTVKPGRVEYIKDDRVETLLWKHKIINGKQKKYGWRVQIFFDSGNNSKSRAFSKKGLFMAKFPDVGSYMTFQSPNYKIRVGDFRTRMDAEGFKQQILGDFPDAFVVKDEINYPSF